MDEMSLKDIASAAAANDGIVTEREIQKIEAQKREEAASAASSTPAPTPSLADDEDNDFIIGQPKKKEEAKEEKETAPNTIPQAVPIPIDSGINLSPVEPTAEQKFQMMWKAKLPDERKALIMIGMTPEEAEQALKARYEKELAKVREANPQAPTVQEEVTEEPVEEKEAVAEIKIDKSQDMNDLGLTKEEHDKLSKVRSIKLVEVEDAELASITIKKVDSNHKADFIKSIESTLSKYSVPLPILGDFVPFKGAQIIQLVNAIEYNDESVSESITKRASLIYEKLMNGKLMKKYDDDGKVIMSYQEFINTFPYQDIDMGLYAILCASSAEESSASLTCTKCEHTYDQKYNVKTIMKMDGLTDLIKQRFEDVLANKGSAEKLMGLMNLTRSVKRYKSPFTGNIYDMNPPSVGRAISILEKVDQEDQVALYTSAMALYLNRVLILDKATEEYVEITEDEPDLLLQTVMELPDEDTQMLLHKIQDTMSYTPQFAIPTKCPKCGNKHDVPIAVRELVFLKAQDSLMEIQ